MPFDNVDASMLPSDRDTPLAVYCRSGTLSAIAVQRLLALRCRLTRGVQSGLHHAAKFRRWFGCTPHTVHA